MCPRPASTIRAWARSWPGNWPTRPASCRRSCGSAMAVCQHQQRRIPGDRIRRVRRGIGRSHARQRAAGRLDRSLSPPPGAAGPDWSKPPPCATASVADHGKLYEHAVADDSQPADASLRSVARAGKGARGLRQDAVRQCLPAGPAAGRSGRDVRRGGVAGLGHAFRQFLENPSRCAGSSISRSPNCSTISKQRGLLERTLVVWMGEFGRTPQDQSARRPRPFSAGVQRGAGRRRHSRRPGAGRDRSRAAKRSPAGRSAKRTCSRRSTRAWASTPPRK